MYHLDFEFCALLAISSSSSPILRVSGAASHVSLSSNSSYTANNAFYTCVGKNLPNEFSLIDSLIYYIWGRLYCMSSWRDAFRLFRYDWIIILFIINSLPPVILHSDRSLANLLNSLSLLLFNYIIIVIVAVVAASAVASLSYYIVIILRYVVY